MVWIWLGIFLFFLTIEGFSSALIALWFAAGALASMFVSMATDSIWIQLGVFTVVSAGSLLALRPLLRKNFNAGKTATNADRVIGMRCQVVETVDNAAGRGIVNAGGRTWSARTDDGASIEQGAWIEVLSIEGSKLIVKEKIEQEGKSCQQS